MDAHKELPTLHELHNIANSTRFPSSPGDIADSAKHAGISQTSIDFLKLFSSDLLFDSKVDFLTRCGDLEILIEQEAEMPKEISRGP